MNEPIVLIIASNIRWQTKIKAAFGNSTTPHFAENYQAAISIIKDQLIGCVIVSVHITSPEELTPITAFRNNCSHSPLILYGDVADKELCVEVGKIGIEAYFETNQLKELVAKAQSLIEQRKFKIDFSQFGIDVERCPITIKRALKIIEKDFLKIKTVTEIADHLKISLNHLEREFARCCNISCKKLLIGLKLFYAGYLMENKRDWTLAQIASESCFKEVHYFYRIFKNLTGINASLYQKNHRSEEFQAVFIKYVNQMKK